MDVSKLTPDLRRLRMDIRNFLLTADRRGLEIELEISLSRGAEFRAECVRELLAELDRG